MAEIATLSVSEVLAKLISFPTICKTPNETLVDWVEEQFLSLGAKVKRLPGEVPGSYSLIATIGPDTDNGVIFSAHSDVVPVEGQPWTTDPFRMTEVGHKLVGRGTSDMKGFLACMLISALHATALDRESKLRDPIHYCVSYDEEIGCVGVRSLLAFLKAKSFKAQGCIIGEPTEMKVATGHKGKLAVSVVCRGLSAHSSNPRRGCNAVLLACELIREVESLQRDLESSDVHDASYEVPYSTAQVGIIRGGVALNIVPDRCEFQFEMRLLKGADAKGYVARIQTAADKLLQRPEFEKGSVEIQELNGYPGLYTPDDSRFVKRLTSKGGRINFGTEGGLFQEYLPGLPVVVCGPGSIDRAHKADEWITQNELEDGVGFLKAVIEELA